MRVQLTSDATMCLSIRSHSAVLVLGLAGCDRRTRLRDRATQLLGHCLNATSQCYSLFLLRVSWPGGVGLDRGDDSFSSWSAEAYLAAVRQLDDGFGPPRDAADAARRQPQPANKALLVTDHRDRQENARDMSCVRRIGGSLHDRDVQASPWGAKNGFYAWNGHRSPQ